MLNNTLKTNLEGTGDMTCRDNSPMAYSILADTRSLSISTSGIYCIKNLVNGKAYIGQSISLYNRKYNHFKALKDNTHGNLHLQNAYNEYGKENFKFYILENADKDLLNAKEKEWIRYYKSNEIEYGYNLTNGGDSNIVFSDEVKKRISLKVSNYIRLNGSNRKGKPLSTEHKKKISMAISKALKGRPSPLLGRPRTEETKMKLSILAKGRISHLRGKHLPLKTRLKMSLAMTGRKHSDLTKLKMSIFRKGKPRSQEIRNKISLSSKGKILSEETKSKLSESAKRRWAEKKEIRLLEAM